jgi:hypothetical protein
MRRPNTSHNNIVRPLGRYGRAYRLSRRLFLYYRIYTTCAWTLIIGSISLYVIYNDIGFLKWQRDIFLSLAIASAGLCLAGQLGIASRGSITDDERELRRVFAVKRAYYAPILVACITVAAGTIFFMYHEYSQAQPIRTLPTVILVTAIYVFTQVLSKLRSKV